MLNIRRKQFETNSSSVHGVTLVTEEEYQKWNWGDYYLDFHKGCIYSPKEAESIANDIKEKWDYGDDYSNDEILRDEKIFNSDQFEDYTENYEVDEQVFEKNGEKFYVVSYDGYD